MAKIRLATVSSASSGAHTHVTLSVPFGQARPIQLKTVQP